MNKTPITVQATINAPLEKVWQFWTEPQHITNWAFASDDWEAPESENNVTVGGTFKTVMAAKDKSAQFDFTGTYTAVDEKSRLEYDMDDGRHVKITFAETPKVLPLLKRLIRKMKTRRKCNDPAGNQYWTILKTTRKQTEFTGSSLGNRVRNLSRTSRVLVVPGLLCRA